jgi:hypothetical protein
MVHFGVLGGLSSHALFVGRFVIDEHAICVLLRRTFGIGIVEQILHSQQNLLHGQWFLWLSVANRSNPLGIKHSPERRIGFPRSPFGLRILFSLAAFSNHPPFGSIKDK